MPAKKPRPEEKSQIERFKETAREIETDESPDEFDKAFGKVVTPLDSRPHPSDKPTSS
jgi:hypothetical protein